MFGIAAGAISGSITTLAIEHGGALVDWLLLHIGDVAMFIGFLLACALWGETFPRRSDGEL